jgi:RNA polymerase sporulation-specific sigma factor
MQSSFDRYSDEELIDRLRDGEAPVMDYLMNKYKNMVRSKARSMYILGADQEDLIQEGMIGLFKAVRDYDGGRDASFSTFADLCISRQMYTAVETSRRAKHMPLNTYVSIYSSVTRDGGDSEGAQLMDVLPELSSLGPEATVIDEESVRSIGGIIERELSPFEKKVLDLYLVGMRNTSIAKVLGRSEKSTDNALQRIKAKLRRAIGSNGENKAEL